MRRWGSALVLVVALGSSVLTASAGAAATQAVHLQFRPVLAQLPSAGKPDTTTAADGATARAAVRSCDPAALNAVSAIPTTSAAGNRPGACVVLPESPGGAQVARYYLGPAGLTDSALSGATPRFQSGQGWTIVLRLTPAGSRAWDTLAQAQFHRQVALVADGLVLAAPEIQPADQTFQSFDGSAVISGNFTAKSAKALAAGLRRTIAAERR